MGEGERKRRNNKKTKINVVSKQKLLTKNSPEERVKETDYDEKNDEEHEE